MSINKLFLSIAAVALASNSHATLIALDIIAGANQQCDGKHDTWQVIARFNDANDKLLNVNDELFSLEFFTGGGELYNQAFGAGQPLNDFPSVGIGGEAYDSYVTTGATTFPHNTKINIEGEGEPLVQVIMGSSLSIDGLSWFYDGDPPPVSDLDLIPGNETFDVIIAQFTVDKNVGIHLGGNILWKNFGGNEINSPFVVDNIGAELCPWDLDESGGVSTADILLLFAAWGSDPCGPPDFNDDGVVNTSDLLALLANWGPCHK